MKEKYYKLFHSFCNLFFGYRILAEAHRIEKELHGKLSSEGHLETPDSVTEDRKYMVCLHSVSFKAGLNGQH